MTREPSLRVEPSSETPSPKDAQVVGGDDWAIAAELICSAVEQRVEVTARKTADDLYEQIMTGTQDYLRSNVDFNLSSELSSLRASNNRFRNSHEANEAKIAAAVKALELVIEHYGEDSDVFMIARHTLSSLKEGK